MDEALDMGAEQKLDVVLVAPNAEPPVCKLMNYGKYKFEMAKKEKEARKNQKVLEVKEIRVTPNIEQHDFDFKAKNARRFIEDGNKVRITVKFRGREMNYTKQGEETLKNNSFYIDKIKREELNMPKLKTNKAAKKRYSYTATGKVKRTKSNRRHLLANKTSRQKSRGKVQDAYVDKTGMNHIKKLLPYGN